MSEPEPQDEMPPEVRGGDRPADYIEGYDFGQVAYVDISDDRWAALHEAEDTDDGEEITYTDTSLKGNSQ